MIAPDGTIDAAAPGRVGIVTIGAIRRGSGAGRGSRGVRARSRDGCDDCVDCVDCVGDGGASDDDGGGRVGRAGARDGAASALSWYPSWRRGRWRQLPLDSVLKTAIEQSRDARTHASRMHARTHARRPVKEKNGRKNHSFSYVYQGVSPRAKDITARARPSKLLILLLLFRNVRPIGHAS